MIAQIVLQGSLNMPLEERGRVEPSLEAGSSADELKAGRLAGIIELDQIGETPLKAAGQGIGQRQELPDKRIEAGLRSGALQSGAADCSRHEGGSKGPITPSGGGKGPPQLRKGGGADPKNNRRTCAALEATRTMKRPVRSPPP